MSGAAIEFTLAELTAQLGGELLGANAGDIVVQGIASPERANEDQLSFIASRRHAGRLNNTRAAAVVIPPALRDATSQARIVCADPYLFFARASQLFQPPPPAAAGVADTARCVDAPPPCASIGAGASLAAGVKLGRNVIIGAGCHLGAGVCLGDNTRLHANVTIYAGCQLGARCIVHSGAVIGADGFGFARQQDGEWVKIEQSGSVIIGDDVEIGANTTIDRGALDDTRIGNGVKIDNLVQIAHNVHIGEHTAIAGCAGIAGSAKIGARCMIGGQAGISGHLSICDDAVISAWSLISKSIARPGIYTASLPQQSHREWSANFAHLRHLNQLAQRVRALERNQKSPLAKQDSKP